METHSEAELAFAKKRIARIRCTPQLDWADPGIRRRAQAMQHEAAVQRRGARFPESGNQPGLGLARLGRPGKYDDRTNGLSRARRHKSAQGSPGRPLRTTRGAATPCGTRAAARQPDPTAGPTAP